MKLSETLNDFLHDLDSAEGWAESDRHDRELAADFEAFTLPSRALITSIIRKYRKDHLEDSLDSYYVRKVLRDAPKLCNALCSWRLWRLKRYHRQMGPFIFERPHDVTFMGSGLPASRFHGQPWSRL